MIQNAVERIGVVVNDKQNPRGCPRDHPIRGAIKKFASQLQTLDAYSETTRSTVTWYKYLSLTF